MTASIYSQRLERLAPSLAVPNILKLAERPEVISLAGGLPDPRCFPIDRIRESMDRVLSSEGAAAMNYGPNPGLTKLRHWIAARMATKQKIDASVDNVMVSSGGVDGLNLVALALLDRGDTVLVEAPTYMVMLHIIRAYECEIETVTVDQEGANPDELEAKLKKLSSAGRLPKFFYVIPAFQNPSGRLMTRERRERIVEICARYGVRIVEDNAYGELSFDEEPIAPLASLDPTNVIFIHTFSKIFGPGVRLGWVSADKELINNLSLCKVGTDQCSNTLTQRLVLEYGMRGYIDDQVAECRKLYRRKRDCMVASLRKEMPSELEFDSPGGGFFVWIRLQEDLNSEELLSRAIEQHSTAFVAGTPFYHDGRGDDFIRLAFSYVEESQIEEGVRRLGSAIKSR